MNLARSKNMAAIRSVNTRPERRVRSVLHRAGLRFRLHTPDLPGSPDLVFRKYRIAVFVHGCFWHEHGCARGHMPKTNVEFWTSKLARNKARDRRVHHELTEAGWLPFVIWECSLELGTEELVSLLQTKSPRRDAIKR